jgi:hypothetical protein
MRLIELGDGWFRFEDEECTEALEQVLGRNHPTSKSAPA